MGLWNDQVLPRLTDRLLNDASLRRARAEVCAGLVGDVVELGFGSGLNVPYYPDTVTGVWAIDPSEVGLRLAAHRVDASPVPVVHAGFTAEVLPFPDRRFDAALSTFTLCTVPDVAQALRELVRVLVPGGRFHFLEHGRAPDAGVARWQDRLAPLNHAIAGGCHLDRDIAALVRDAGLEVLGLSTYYGEGPRPFAYRYQGVARRPVGA
ncbi:MAG: class I SAM-dependent methyltransferase [Actinomycetota bacterium]|nr:class I SAM-dependent methyltransferase [Actinomycetota bacterium]